MQLVNPGSWGIIFNLFFLLTTQADSETTETVYLLLHYKYKEM